MLASSLEAVLCGASRVMSTQLLPAKTEVCVWVLASSVIHWHLTYPELPRTREKPGIWHNVVTFSELMFQNIGSSILVLRKGPRILGSVIFSNLVGGWAPAQLTAPAGSTNVRDSHFTFLFCIPGRTHRSFCQKAHLARKMKNREQEVGEAFYGMAFSPLFLKGFFLQFMSVWVRSMC